MKVTSPKRGILEAVILILVFAIVFVFLINSYKLEKRVCREQQLMGELAMLRSGLGLYAMVEHRKPDNLVQLCSTKYRLPGTEANQGFVDLIDIRVNDRGELLDPFGNPYAYDRQRPWIASTTKGFQNW